MTEDKVRKQACKILGFQDSDDVQADVGQLTTFNQLGFPGVNKKPDGWYLPNDLANVAIVLETKASNISLGSKQIAELRNYVKIVGKKYKKVVGILYNGEAVLVFKNQKRVDDAANRLQPLNYYINLFTVQTIDKEHIYDLTAKINHRLHFEFRIKNLYHRMIFTACALVAKRYGALMVEGMDYSMFHNAILNRLKTKLSSDIQRNIKLNTLIDVFTDIKMNLGVTSKKEKSKQQVTRLITEFIGWVKEISDCLDSAAWRGEDVMGIFFNEFNRYKSKADAGQVFTPEHITDFMYKILEVNENDRVLDACCGSGGFLVKAMSNMIQKAGVGTEEATKIKSEQLYGIESDREIYALACANMLIHNDGKTNLEWMDARTEDAGEWIASKNITKVLMNPPYENKYECMEIVENILNHVSKNTLCGFILPDKKLEKAKIKQIESILKKHRLIMIIKLPENLFFKIGITTSIFVFKSGVQQDDNNIFTCYIKTDGLETVKNKGRHDVYQKWLNIEKYWVNSIKERHDKTYKTAKWIKPPELPIKSKKQITGHLSYQMPKKTFRIFKEDFKKTAMDYLMYQKGINTKEFNDKLLATVMYSSNIQMSKGNVNISIKTGDNNGRD